MSPQAIALLRVELSSVFAERAADIARVAAVAVMPPSSQLAVARELYGPGRFAMLESLFWRVRVCVCCRW